jgi:uncharacterized protein (DUF952 family)
MGLFHIAEASDWAAAHAVGAYSVSTRGRSLDEEGFIHCSSSREQAAGVLERYYADLAGVPGALLLLVIDEARVGAEVRVEGGFPHLYGPLPVDAVVAVEPV